MKQPYIRIERILVIAVALMLGACSKQETQSSDATFATPEEAAAALAAAAQKHDVAELGRLFGPGTEDLLKSGDDVADRTAREAFFKRYQAKHQLVSGGPDDLMLQVGDDDWPLPVPLVKEDGRWRFDEAAGADMIVRQRIGANELHTIDVMRGYVAAQEEYAAEGHDGAPPVSMRSDSAASLASTMDSTGKFRAGNP